MPGLRHCNFTIHHHYRHEDVPPTRTIPFVFFLRFPLFLITPEPRSSGSFHYFAPRTCRFQLVYILPILSVNVFF